MNVVFNTLDDQPKISIIIPTYQRARLLHNAINSVLCQTYSNFQVCVYDNCSSDETQDIVKQLMKNDPRIKYHRHQKNIGMIANYKFSFEQINTPFFSFLSDDDTIFPCYFETALNDFQQHPDAGFVACSIHAIDQNGNFLRDSLSEWNKEGYIASPEGLYEMIRPPKYPIPTGVLFNRSVIQHVKPNWSEELQLLWDPDYLIQIAAQFPIVINKKKCGHFLAHSNAFSTSFYEKLHYTAKPMKILLSTNKRMLLRLKRNKNILKEVRKKGSKILKAGFQETSRYFLRHYYRSRKHKDFFYCLCVSFIYFGFDRQLAKEMVQKMSVKAYSFLQTMKSKLKRIIKICIGLQKEN